jgi:hypothetical protein
MTDKPATLMSELDRAAFDLITRHFPQDKPQGSLLPDSQDQIKAFDAVVKYYGPRTKLGKDEEKPTNEYTRLRDKLHGRRTPRRRADSTEGEGAANGAASIADEPAGSA